MFITSSCSHSSKLWVLQKISSSNPSYDAARIFFTTNSFLGLELEITRVDKDLCSYINVFSQEIPIMKGHSNKSLLTISSNNTQQTFVTNRLQGGQRILLPKEATNLIIDELNKNKTLRIIIPNSLYDGEIISSNFSKVFKKLNDIQA